MERGKHTLRGVRNTLGPPACGAPLMTPELMACSVVVKRPATLLPMRSLGNPNLKFRMGLFETNLVKFVKKKNCQNLITPPVAIARSTPL